MAALDDELAVAQAQLACKVVDAGHANARRPSTSWLPKRRPRRTASRSPGRGAASAGGTARARAAAALYGRPTRVGSGARAFRSPADDARRTAPGCRRPRRCCTEGHTTQATLRARAGPRSSSSKCKSWRWWPVSRRATPARRPRPKQDMAEASEAKGGSVLGPGARRLRGRLGKASSSAPKGAWSPPTPLPPRPPPRPLWRARGGSCTRRARAWRSGKSCTCNSRPRARARAAG